MRFERMHCLRLIFQKSDDIVSRNKRIHEYNISLKKAYLFPVIGELALRQIAGESTVQIKLSIRMKQTFQSVKTECTGP